MLELRGVGKVYDQRGTPVHAVGSVSLDVRDGEFLTLLGPSGCGKSTLLMMMGGLETPSAGGVRTYRFDIVLQGANETAFLDV